MHAAPAIVRSTVLHNRFAALSGSGTHSDDSSGGLDAASYCEVLARREAIKRRLELPPGGTGHEPSSPRFALGHKAGWTTAPEDCLGGQFIGVGSSSSSFAGARSLAEQDDTCTNTTTVKHHKTLKQDDVGQTFDSTFDSGSISQYSTADTLPRLATEPKAGWQTYYGDAKRRNMSPRTDEPFPLVGVQAGPCVTAHTHTEV